MRAPYTLPLNKRGFLILLLCIPLVTWCQHKLPVIHFKTGHVSPRFFLRHIDAADPVFQSGSFDGKVYLLVQFKKIPAAPLLQQIKNAGIQLLQYIPDNTYLVSVNRPVAKAVLQQLGVINLQLLNSSNKLASSLRSTGGAINSKAIVHGEVVASCYENIAEQKLLAAFEERQVRVTAQLGNGVYKVTVAPGELNTLVNAPFIAYIEPVSPPPDTLNGRSGIVHGTHLLQGHALGVGRNLTGKGVVIGVGDVGGIANHIDHAYKTYEGNGTVVSHGTHVAGTVAGAGLINPRFKGAAPGATLITRNIYDIIDAAPGYYEQFGMVLTNNSYGIVPTSCEATGGYSYISRSLDLQLLQYPELMQVFAAGNSGGKLCVPYPVGYKTMAADYQAAKNVITVAGDDILGTNYYSKGPTSDGRLKPEIAAFGFSVHSTVPNNRYGVNYGSSMAAPQVTGVLALMYERYRQLNNQHNPPAALMKTIVCNAATDYEVPGPDFAQGYGWLNALPAIEMIEQKQYLHDSLQQNQEKTFPIEVKEGAHQLKVMLYWNDVPPSYFSAIALVNDLDITITAPDGTVHRPWGPDTLDVMRAAKEREDHINNMEQVVISDPMPGRYIVKIKGFAIPFGKKDFFITHYQPMKGFRLLYPAADETWKGNEVQVVSWQNFDAAPAPYQIDASVDNGVTWQPIGTNQAGLPGHLTVYVPNAITRTARIRVTNMTTGQQVMSDPFMIAPEIDYTLTSLCDETARLSWNQIPGIDSMEVMMVRAGEMKRMGITTDASFIVRKLSNDSVYWLTVRPYVLGAGGERSIAKSVQTIDAPCTLTQQNGDIRLESVVAPVSGRKSTSTQRGNAEAVTVRIKNLAAVSTNTPIVLQVYLNHVLWATENVAVTIAAHGTYDHTFAKQLDCTVPGKYLLEVMAEKADDPDTDNNAITKLVKIADNPVITLPYTESFNGLKDTVYRFPGYFGLEGAETWDSEIDRGGKLLTVQGYKALAPDTDGNLYPTSAYLYNTGTFNLSAYGPNDVILLSFGKAGAYNSTGKMLYVRGADYLSWITVPLPYSNAAGYGTRDIDLTRILNNAGQTYTASTQIKWRQAVSGFYHEDVPSHLDDVELVMVQNDVQCTSLKTDTTVYWGRDTIPVKVQVVNNHKSPVNNVQVSLQLPNGTVMQGSIAAIQPFDTVYTGFVVPAMGALPNNTALLKAWATCATDSYHGNDTGRTTLTIIPVINTFPYVENFEQGRQQWTSNPVYALVGAAEQYKVGKAASGNNSWYVANIDTLSFPPSGSAITSTSGFDLTGMVNPFISFSLSENLRPGRDFASVRVSFAKGRTQTTLQAVPDACNWYTDTRGWMDSTRTYWHVVSAPLPKKDSIALIYISVRFNGGMVPYLPSASQGPGIDDIHIYDRGYTVETVTTPQSGVQTVSGNQWTTLQQNNNIIAAINANGQDLGSVSYEQQPVAGEHKILNGYKVLNRRWVIRSSKTPAKPVIVRLYFSDVEANLLRLTDSCHGCNPDTISAYDFGVYQYQGPASTINTSLHDNVQDAYTLVKAADFMLVPYDKGYYAELPVWPNRELYMMVPERYASPAVQFAATPDGATRAVSLTWQVGDQTALSRYVLEMAGSDADYDNGHFTELNRQDAGANGPYQYNDNTVKADGRYYYRLRLEYKNGYYRYTDTKVAGFGKAGSILVYPNPSNTGMFNLVIASISAGTTMQLTNSLGQQLWVKQIRPAGGFINIPVDLSLPRFANGVYFLKMTHGTEVQVVRLVKMK
jgi:hypothetical protein